MTQAKKTPKGACMKEEDRNGKDAHEVATIAAHYGCQLMVNAVQTKEQTKAQRDLMGKESPTFASALEPSFKERLGDAVKIAQAGAQAYLTCRRILVEELKEKAPAPTPAPEVDED